jgi:hypothetical protein
MNAMIRTEPDRQKAHDMLDRLKLEGNRQYRFEVKLYRRQRTLPQNRLLHLLINAIAEETGGADKDHREAIKTFLKQKFLEPQFQEVFGVEVEMQRSTRALDTAEFTRFINAIYDWAERELGIMLPRPGDLGWDDLCARFENVT